MTSPRTLLSAWNLRAKKEFGQNFLADPSTAEMIVARTGILPEDTVVEIGAGLGALTIPAARIARRVLAVEKDARMVELLSAELLAAGQGQVEILNQDVLDLDLSELARNHSDTPVVVMGNLPYNISSQVLVRLVAHRSRIDRAVLMFQKELAQRLTATPGTKAYGRITVMLGYCADISKVADVAAPLFFPRPKVDSQVIEIRFRPPKPLTATDEEFLFRVVKAGFGQRRKTLRNALRSGNFGLPPEALEIALAKADIDPIRRAETLSVAEFVRLGNGILARLPNDARGDAKR
jgi:16S rRNA (adenine1518-N6/adenine1519-N6)-dimethyltransferase